VCGFRTPHQKGTGATEKRRISGFTKDKIIQRLLAWYVDQALGDFTPISKLIHLPNIGIGIATIFIFIRCCYRVAELESGFGGALANNEPVFMILEGPMIMIAVIALAAFHPGFCLGGLWASIEKNPAIWSGSPLRRLWATVHRSTRKPSKKGTEYKPQKAMSTPSTRNSKEDFSSE
jgi:hypothetical protein